MMKLEMYNSFSVYWGVFLYPAGNQGEHFDGGTFTIQTTKPVS